MRKRLHLHRTLVFHDKMPRVEQARALMAEPSEPWYVEDPFHDSDRNTVHGPSYIHFHRSCTDSDPGYRVTLWHDGDNYVLWGIYLQASTDYLALDEWNLVATFFENEILLRAAKAAPELTYHFTPEHQAPEDWFKPETCKHLRNCVAAGGFPCDGWNDPSGEEWLSFLGCLSRESDDYELSVPLCDWLQLVKGWSKDQIVELLGVSAAVLAYSGRLFDREEKQAADELEAA